MALVCLRTGAAIASEPAGASTPRTLVVVDPGESASRAAGLGTAAGAAAAAAAPPASSKPSG